MRADFAHLDFFTVWHIFYCIIVIYDLWEPIMKHLSLYHVKFFSLLHFIGWVYQVELELTLLFQVKITKLTQFHLINSPNKV